MPSTHSFDVIVVGGIGSSTLGVARHVVGTCAMGSSPEEGAVVDGGGRVFGTEGLYVVDASIMPIVPSGFTRLATIMIAERLSEQIAAFPR
jgi:choline dehydrogenase-like flavoprotein